MLQRGLTLEQRLELTWQVLLTELAPASQPLYDRDRQHFVEWLAGQTVGGDELDRATLENYRSHLLDNYAASTARRMLSVTRRLLEVALQAGYLDFNPASNLAPLSAQPATGRLAVTPLRRHEVEQLFNKIDLSNGLGKRDYALLSLLLNTELKLNEALLLKVGDFHLDLGQLCLAKPPTNRVIQLPPQVVITFQKYLSFVETHLESAARGPANRAVTAQLPLFVSFKKGGLPTHQGIARRQAEIIIATRGQNAGLAISAQALRATYMSQAAHHTSTASIPPEGGAAEKVRKLGTLVSVARKLTSYRSMAEVTSQILGSAVEAIETADSGIFYLYEPSTGFLKVLHTIGFTEAIYRLTVRPGEIMSGKAFASGTGLIFNNTDEWLAGFANSSPTTKAVFMEGTNGRIPQSALIVPLKLQEQAIGVIALDNFRVEKAFTADDMGLLQLMANQAAIALDNVRLYEYQASLVQRLEQTIQIHDRLTGSVLKGQGFEGVVATLDALLGNPVILFDSYGEVKAASFDGPNFYQARDYFQDWLLDEQAAPGYYGGSNFMAAAIARPVILNQVLKPRGGRLTPKKGETISLKPAPPYQETPSARSETGLGAVESALVVPVNVGGDLLGMIMVVPFNKPLGEFDSLALEHAATVFGLEFMKQQALFEVEVRWKGDLIDDLLANKISPDFEKRAQTLGIEINLPLICLFFSLDRLVAYTERTGAGTTSVELRRVKERIYQTITSLVKAVAPSAFISLKNSEIIAFINVTSLENASIVELTGQIAHNFQSWLARFYQGLAVSIAVSGVSSSPEGMVRALNEAQRVLDLYHKAGRYGELFYTEELGADRLLLQLPDSQELLRFAEQILGEVIEYDRENNTGLLATLAAYCFNSRNIVSTAQNLHMHQNTVRYRLERINELLSEKITKKESWLNVELAIRILRLYGRVSELPDNL